MLEHIDIVINAIVFIFLAYAFFVSSKISGDMKKSNDNCAKKLKLCNIFIEEHPNNLYAIEKRAQLYLLLNQYEESINDYRYLMSKKPNDTYLTTSCAYACAHSGDLRAALNLINDLYENKEKDDRYYIETGNCLETVQNYSAAIENFTKAIELNPKNSHTYFSRAMAYSRLGNFRLYENDMKKHDELRKEEEKHDIIQENDSVKSYMDYLEENNFNPTYEEKEENTPLYTKELELCNSYIENHPDNFYGKERRANLYLLLNQYQKSIEEYKYLMNKKPDDYRYILGYARAYSHSDNLSLALNTINNFYIGKDKDYLYYLALGEIYYITKNYETAIENYTKAINLSDEHFAYLYYQHRAKVYKEIGQMDKYNADMKKYNESEELQKKEHDDMDSYHKYLEDNGVDPWSF